jgi:crotonobetainyl-CoA:carnitine CoA-transferase CaiB-like acyl-CoA transferase
MVSRFHELFTGNRVGFDPVPVSDGYFTLRTPEIDDTTWRALASAIGRDDLVDDPGFAGPTARREHRREIEDLVQSWARTRTRQEVWLALKDLGYFGAPVLSLGEVLEDPHVRERQAFVQRDHPNAGPTTLLAPWIHLSETPSSIHDDSPSVGQHTDEVLSDVLGLAPRDVEALHAQGVVQ